MVSNAEWGFLIYSYIEKPKIKPEDCFTTILASLQNTQLIIPQIIKKHLIIVHSGSQNLLFPFPKCCDAFSVVSSFKLTLTSMGKMVIQQTHSSQPKKKLYSQCLGDSVG